MTVRDREALSSSVNDRLDRLALQDTEIDFVSVGEKATLVSVSDERVPSVDEKLIEELRDAVPILIVFDLCSEKDADTLLVGSAVGEREMLPVAEAVTKAESDREEVFEGDFDEVTSLVSEAVTERLVMVAEKEPVALAVIVIDAV